MDPNPHNSPPPHPSLSPSSRRILASQGHPSAAPPHGVPSPSHGGMAHVLPPQHPANAGPPGSALAQQQPGLGYGPQQPQHHHHLNLQQALNGLSSSTAASSSGGPQQASSSTSTTSSSLTPQQQQQLQQHYAAAAQERARAAAQAQQLAAQQQQQQQLRNAQQLQQAQQQQQQQLRNAQQLQQAAQMAAMQQQHRQQQQQQQRPQHQLQAPQASWSVPNPLSSLGGGGGGPTGPSASLSSPSPQHPHFQQSQQPSQQPQHPQVKQHFQPPQPHSSSSQQQQAHFSPPGSQPHHHHAQHPGGGHQHLVARPAAATTAAAPPLSVSSVVPLHRPQPQRASAAAAAAAAHQHQQHLPIHGSGGQPLHSGAAATIRQGQLGVPNPQQHQQLPHRAPPPPGGSTGTSSSSTTTKKKLLLTPESKQALARAIWSAIRSPTGTVDPDLMQAALQTGIPRVAIESAARAAREREMQKRQQKLQAEQQQQQQQQQTLRQQQQQQFAQQQQQQQQLSQQQQQQLIQQQQLMRQQQLQKQASQQAHQQQQHRHQQQLQQQQAHQQQRLVAHAPSSAAQVRSPSHAHGVSTSRIQAPAQSVASSAVPLRASVSVHQQQQQQSQAQVQLLRQQQQQQALRQQQLQQQQAREAELKTRERALWKRAQNGTFMMQKERFLAVPYSVGAMVKSRDVGPVLLGDGAGAASKKRSAADAFLAEAKAIQHTLKMRAIMSGPETSLLDPARFKRSKIEPKKFAKALDRFVRKSRQGAAESLSKQHKEVCKTISSHQQDFFKFHRQRKADAMKIAKTIRDSMDKEVRKKEKDAVQAEKARLAALKANDMTAYSKLLEETKNERLKFLLEKTEKHFSQISTLLEKRKDDAELPGAAGGGKATSYYATAHSRTEEVRQPTILVGGDLKEYQLTGLQWLVSLYNNKLNGILADEMGLGKTIQAISLIAYLMEFKQNLGPFLVIVPLSTLSNWQNEFTKWCPTARTVCYKGTPVQRKEIYKDQVRAGHFNVLLTTYEYIIKDKKFLRRIEWQYAVVDEGHRMKNAQSKFAVTLGSQYITKFRVLLTGTPLMNDLSELWSLLNFLLPSIFNSVETFDQWFSAPFSQFGGSSSGGNNNEEDGEQLLSNEERILVIHRLHELLRPFMLRRVKSEVLDQLPEKIEKVLRCDLSSWQKELYKQISAKAVVDNGLGFGAADSSVPARGLNNVVMQLRKVCNHPFLFSPEGYHINDVMIRSSGKFALLDQMLPKLKMAGHRCLIFTQMTTVMTILEDYFAYRGYLSLRLDGSTPAEEREKRMYKFNSPDSPYFIFLLSTRAGGLGLNLTAADTVIILDSDWNPMMDLQAQDRAHRIGQRSDVSVFRLITNSPVEEKILSRATEKLSVSELVVESGQFNKESVENDNSLERKRMMEVLLTDFDTLNREKGVVSEKSGSDGGDEDEDGSEASDKEDLNELLSNNEADYQLYSAYDKQREDDGLPYPALYTSQSDVPDWIWNPRPAGAKGVLMPIDEGPRKRKDVMYDDGLTEKQFLRIMDKQARDEESSAKKKGGKKRRGAAASASTSKVAHAASAADDDESLDDVPAEASNTDLTDWTFRKLISCSKSVVSLKEPGTKRRVAEIFLDKPDPATFPDYYEIIDKPIAINDILRKCRSKVYATIREFRDDWSLMFSNARKFNGESSWVVDDAKALEKELERVLKNNGFSDTSIPIGKKKKLRIKLSLKNVQTKEND